MGDEKVIALLLMQQIAVLFLIMGLGFLIREAWNRKDRGQQGTFHGDDLFGFALRDDPCFSD